MKVEDEKLDEFINKLLPYTCPLCGEQKWSVSDNIFFLPDFEKEGIKWELLRVCLCCQLHV